MLRVLQCERAQIRVSRATSLGLFVGIFNIANQILFTYLTYMLVFIPKPT